MKRRRGRMLLTMAGLVIACDAGRAQDFVSPDMSPIRSVAPAPKEGSGSGSWLWIHTDVAVQVAGSFADWATSWKQPEGNQWLAESRGQYAGTLYRSGTPRKYVGVFNMAVGGGFGAAAVSNVVRNPYYKP